MYYAIAMVVVAILAYFYVQSIKPAQPAPPTLDDLQVPTAEDGREVIDCGGTVWIDDPNVLWFGDLTTQPVKTSSGK